MLKLFQSIFESGGQRGRYPESLIERAIERAVDGTDPRLRGLPGYRKKLRDPVIHAIDQVVGLVEGFGAPLELSRALRATDPELIAFFASFEHLQEVLAADGTLTQWVVSPEGRGAERAVMLLLMAQQERRVLGVALEGDMLRREVPQTTVSFAGHRLVDPAAAEDEARRLLKRRAFDHLLTLGLGGIVAARGERQELEQARNLLQRKHKALAAGRWGFEEAGPAESAEPRAVQRQIEEIESQLQALGAGAGLLKVHLEMVSDVLSRAGEHLWSERGSLCVDRMGVKQAQPSALAPEVPLTVLHNSAGRSLVARLVSLGRGDFPPVRDVLREAQRYLV